MEAVPRKIKMVAVTSEMIKLETRTMKIHVSERVEVLKTPAEQTLARLVTTKWEELKQNFKSHKR